MKLKDMSLDEMIADLTKLRDSFPGVKWKVRIPYRKGSKSCVGKILGVTDKGETGTAYLFPVPEDIERVNAIVKMMAMMTCEKASKGQDCGECPDIATCPQMRAIDESFCALGDAVEGETKE